MKKIFWLFCFLVPAVVPAVAQQYDTVFQTREVIIIDEPEPVITNYYDTRYEIRTFPKYDNRRPQRGWSDVSFFSQIGLGYNSLGRGLKHLNLPDEAETWEEFEDHLLPEGYEWMNQKGNSINFNLMLAGAQYNFTPHFGLAMGLELEVNNYRFERDVTLQLDRNGHIAPDWRFRDARLHLEKTKLVNSFLNIPLTLKIGIGRRNQVQLHGGVVGGWRWNSYTKLKADNELLDGKKRYHNNYNLRNFHYGYTAGFAIHNIGLYATYYPHSIFKAGDVDIRQVNVGLLLRY